MFNSINTRDQEAKSIMCVVNSLSSLYHNCESKINEKLSLLDDDVWRELLDDPALRNISSVLIERRKIQKSRANYGVEKTINSLEGDGMHAGGTYIKWFLEI
ncbi:hypothetical protein KW850_27070 [Bacillus sp. sid0103]|uniref:hypothetical protein n=1 Tax=Bacillus sp. sid0103 TaxID=2856337 RepID=UPI001C48F1A8|nr:hypothetical protein [Bacillus sp. sid0103]MBV7508868.1 hypothetical protein [Bacillus sp. sid0103]